MSDNDLTNKYKPGKPEYYSLMTKVYLLLKGPLTDFERDFLKTIYGMLDRISDKQWPVLRKILRKYGWDDE